MRTDDANPFEGCEIDEIMALALDLEGLAGLRALLAHTDLDREDLSQAADRLQQAGLIEAASMARDAAKRAPTRASMEIAKVMADDDEIKRKASFATLYRAGTISLDDLEAQGDIDPETLAFVAKSRQPRRAHR
jgi:hypothetical protein